MTLPRFHVRHVMQPRAFPQLGPSTLPSREMKSTPIVKLHDPIHDIQRCLRSDFITGLVDSLDQNRPEKVLYQSVVSGVGELTQGDRHA